MTKEYSEKDVFIFKLISGEEIIALLHESELLAAGKQDPICTIQNPLSFTTNSEGQMDARPWCIWSQERVFEFPVQHIIICQPAAPGLAQHYFLQQFPDKFAEKVETSTKPGLILPESARSPEEVAKADKILGRSDKKIISMEEFNNAKNS